MLIFVSSPYAADAIMEKDLLEIFEAAPETEAIVMIGDIDGSMEIEAAQHAKDNVSKPVF